MALTILAALLVLFLAFAYYKETGELNYNRIEDKMILDVFSKYGSDTDLSIFDVDALTMDMLEHRTEQNNLYIERCIGIVTNKERDGDGKILNTADPVYNYISYKDSGLDYTDGTIIVTYCIYNPATNACDDVIDRFDYVLSRDWEHREIQKSLLAMH